MKQILIATTAVLALAACSRGGDLNHGGSVTVNGGKTVLSKNLPANLPSYVKIYPGGVVTAVVQNQGAGGIIAFDVDAAPDTVMEFYKKDAADAKLGDGMDSWALNQDHAGGHVIMWNGTGDKRSLTTTVEVKDGKTHVGLVYGA